MDTMYDLQGDSNITNVWTYGGAGAKAGDIFNTSFKDLPYGARLYETTLAPIVRASGYGDVYATFALAQQAYGTVKVSALPSRVIVHEPGSSGAYDPLDQIGTVGYKMNMAAVILDQNNMVRIVHQTSRFTGTRAGL